MGWQSAIQQLKIWTDILDGHQNPEEAVESGKDQLKAAAHNLKEAASAKVEKIRHAVEQKAEELQSATQSKAQELKGTAESWQAEGHAYIRDNPTKSVLIALGLGYYWAFCFVNDSWISVLSSTAEMVGKFKQGANASVRVRWRAPHSEVEVLCNTMYIFVRAARDYEDDHHNHPKNSDAIAIDPLSELKLLAMASVHLSQTEQPINVGMTVTHKNYGDGKVVGEWHSIRSGVPCEDIFDVIFQNRSGRPFLHCCRKEYLTPDPLSSPPEDEARRPVRIRNAGRPALRSAPSPARIYGERLKVGFPFPK